MKYEEKYFDCAFISILFVFVFWSVCTESGFLRLTTAAMRNARSHSSQSTGDLQNDTMQSNTMQYITGQHNTYNSKHLKHGTAYVEMHGVGSSRRNNCTLSATEAFLWEIGIRISEFQQNKHFPEKFGFFSEFAFIPQHWILSLVKQFKQAHGHSKKLCALRQLAILHIL